MLSHGCTSQEMGILLWTVVEKLEHADVFGEA
jgi:hypothetical protein